MRDPRTMNPQLELFVARQNGLITRKQALTTMTQGEIAARLGRRWQVVLPGVYATFTGPLNDQHRARAALLYGGEQAMVSDLVALRLRNVKYLPDEDLVRILVPETVQRSSREFVVVRRSIRLPHAASINGIAVAPAYRALCEFGLRYSDERTLLAVASAAVQAGKVTLSQIIDEAWHGPARGRPRLLRLIEALEAGVRSTPEEDVRKIIANSDVLPSPLYNPWLTLPDGQRLSPDTLFDDAGLIHETNGRDVHAGLDDFEQMQRRHDVLTACGFTVLHNSPRRIREHPAAVCAELESCYRQLRGRGMPAGVIVTPRAM